VGIPLEALPDLVINPETSLIKRDSLPSDCNVTRVFAKTSRESVTVKQKCNSDEVCIEYADEQNKVFAVCTSRDHARQWSTENDNIYSSCSQNEPYKTGGGKNLTLGITTYAKNNVTNQEEKHAVQTINAFLSDKYSLGLESYLDSYSKIIKNYDGNTSLQYCFTAYEPYTEQVVIAYAAVLVGLQSL
ncbi:3693_t:CDS:2, partial [Racocetra fulgida]